MSSEKNDTLKDHIRRQGANPNAYVQQVSKDYDSAMESIKKGHPLSHDQRSALHEAEFRGFGLFDANSKLNPSTREYLNNNGASYLTFGR